VSKVSRKVRMCPVRETWTRSQISMYLRLTRVPPIVNKKVRMRLSVHMGLKRYRWYVKLSAVGDWSRLVSLGLIRRL